jgi:two-component system sensor histidine kinase HydH
VALEAEVERGRRLAALGSMSAVLAHELRNPLTSLKGHAQLLAESAQEHADLKPSADRVVTEAMRLERLMNDLLDFVKKGELRRAPTDPNEVLRAAIASVGASEVRPVFLPAGEKWSLDGDRLQQALENVLRNAVQAGAAGQPVEATVERRSGALRFVVRDHGSGIKPGDEERIFEPFVSDRVRGVGLGLAITRRIVEQHGGVITARNHPEGGAEVVIELRS